MSTSKGFQVLKPGMLSLVQDAGRYGFSHLGVTAGGPMDAQSFYWANRLCGNPYNTAAVEVTVGGLELQAQVRTRVAVCGAKAQLKLNGKPIELWRSFWVEPGDKVAIAYASQGCRNYLAVTGGFEVCPVFGSISTVVRDSLGGLHRDGTALLAGDILPCAETSYGACLRLPEECIPDYSEHLVLRLIPGYQTALFPRSQKRLFYRQSYRVSEVCDRMGYRLQGQAMSTGTMVPLASEGITLGSVQVPSDGQPIVLMRDHQTMGGYPKLGSVLSLDLSKLAQARPGTLVRFQAITLGKARRELILAKSSLDEVKLLGNP